MNIQSQFAPVTYPPVVSGIPQMLVQRTRYRNRGIGDVNVGSAAAIASAGATTTTGILSALSAIAMGSSVAGPIGLAITGLITLGVTLAKVFAGCGQTCTEATAYVNQAEPLLLQNLQTYLAAPIHYASLQAAALNNFNTVWGAVLAACGQASLGQAGVNCISQRQAGACASKNATPGGWVQDASGNWAYQYATGPNSGSSCWNWFIGYHDPIANDPTVVPDPVPGDTASGTGVNTTGAGAGVSTTGGTSGTTASGLPLPLVLAGAALLLMVVVEG